ncbi:helix-turn-helix domain-containing protein [Nonomuraea jiangxiensis]|uniref:Helix-turn-helix domain-containing protein n=1 Tax=Nonomuraea jiangxiensis TaxID=633440 RepID=A0A1G8XU82_9ACTN|nr:helix-turn-helix domain-containing protein [Nonomuraea jiangxiensis]SDJ94139.1 Helix-turn-helix domain-containing protein [Nonomuraea jiangxiensis]
MSDEDRKLIPWWPDAGRLLGGLGRTTMHGLVASGELPSITIGRRRFIATRDIEEYVERRREAARGGSAA